MGPLTLILLATLSSSPAIAPDRESEEAAKRERAEIGWDFKGKLETDHFLIYYGTKKKVAERLSTYGEALYALFVETFGEIVEFEIPLPLKVYVFRKKREYKAYALSQAPHLASPLLARFDPTTRIAYMCEEGSSEKYLVQSFLHENTHALCGQLMGKGRSQGAWLLEGWADYMALSVDFKEKGLSLGNVTQTKKSRHPDMVKLLIRQGKALPLREVVTMDWPTFGRLGQQSYPQAWSLFYFLRHYGSGTYRDGLSRYIKKISQGHGGKEVFEEAIGPLDGIEKEWQEYARTLSSGRRR